MPQQAWDKVCKFRQLWSGLTGRSQDQASMGIAGGEAPGSSCGQWSCDRIQALSSLRWYNIRYSPGIVPLQLSWNVGLRISTAGKYERSVWLDKYSMMVQITVNDPLGFDKVIPLIREYSTLNSSNELRLTIMRQPPGPVSFRPLENGIKIEIHCARALWLRGSKENDHTWVIPSRLKPKYLSTNQLIYLNT
jgi:hypothetical protein